MKKYNKNGQAVRYAIWKAHNHLDFYSGNIIEYGMLEIDHIIPISLKQCPEELNSVLKQLGLPENFELDSLHNYVPTTKTSNNKKKDIKFSKNCCILALEIAKRKVSVIEKMIKSFEDQKDVVENITKLKSIVAKEEKEIENVINILTDEKEFFECGKYLCEDLRFNVYKNSTKRVMIDAFLPSYEKIEGSCLILFKTISVRDCMITLNHEQIVNSLFEGRFTNPEYGLRGFVVCPDFDKSKYYVQLGNNRFTLNSNDLLELCELVDDFSEHYISELKKFEDFYGTRDFKPVKAGRYKLIKIKRSLWKMMLDFANKHDTCNGNTEWHIFSSNWSSIVIYTFKSELYDDVIHATLHPVQDENFMISLTEPDDEVWITWELKDGIFIKRDVDKYNKGGYWNAKMTFNWITEEFIPRVIYECNGNNSLFYKARDFQTFKKEFNVSSHFYIDKITFLDDKQTKSVKDLCELTCKLQAFFSLFNSIFLTAYDYQNLFRAVSLILRYTKDAPLEYVISNLRFTNSHDKEKIIIDIDKHIEGIKDNVVGSFTIDTALRCISVCLRDFEVVLSNDEIEKVMLYLKPFTKIYNEEKLLKKYSKDL